MSTAVKDRPAKASQAKRALEKEREKLFARLQEINEAIQEADTDTAKSGKLTLSKLRAALGWSRNQLAYVMNASDRAIVNWEQGDPISPVYAAKLREVQSVYNELKQLMTPEEIGPWLLSEMEEFEGRTPAGTHQQRRNWSALGFIVLSALWNARLSRLNRTVNQKRNCCDTRKQEDGALFHEIRDQA